MSTIAKKHDVIIIGAGQAGLAASYWLSKQGREHVILERATVGDRWRSERWDSLHFQFPNAFLRLPGHAYRGPEPHAFAHCREILRYIEDYRQKISAPVAVGTDVHLLEIDDAAGRFRLATNKGDLIASQVILATGPFQRPLLPRCAEAMPPDILQLHASRYFNPQQLPPGPVLIVGSGSSGCQIAEELLQSGRDIYLSVGRHRRIPHRYRGRFMLEWLLEMGVFDLPASNLPHGRVPPPILLTGVNGGHGINLRRFAHDGMVLLGKLRGIENGAAHFGDDLELRLTEADESAKDFMRRVDEYTQRAGLPAGDSDPDEFIAPGTPERLNSAAILDLRSVGIATVIWCTGYTFDFDWVQLPIFNSQGHPLQRRGITECRGAYFLGLHWMHTFASGTLFGIGDDADYLINCMSSDIAR